MIEKTLTVKYITSQTCFIYLPVSYRLGTEKCVKLTYGKEKTAYFSLSIPNVNIESQMLGIDSKYAKALGIEEHEPVYVSEIADLPIVTCLSIVPLSKEDYEVLEMLAENVQNTLLEQIRVVNSNQKLIIWIGQNVWVTVTVESVQPICPGKITALTEVHIKPPEENAVLKSKDIQQNQEEASPSKNLNTFLSSFVNSIYSRLFEEPPKKSKVFYDDYDVILRLIPLSSLCQVNHNTKSFYPFNVFVLKDSLGANFININSNSSPLFGCITLVDPAVTSVKEIYVRVCCIEDFIDFKNITIFSTENVFVSDLVLNHFECCLGTRIILKQVHKQPLVNEIEIHSKKTYLEDMVEKLKFYLTSSTFPFILNSDIAMKVDDNFTFSVKLLPDFSNYCIIDENFLRNCKYSIHNECVNLKELNVKTLEHGDEYVQISNFKNIVEDAVNNFSSKQLENVLITGKPGTGKSTLVKTVSLKLSKFPYFIYSEAISCRQVKGKTIESLSKMLTITVSKLILCQPSILILEDLDVLCEKCQGEETPNSLYFNRISEMLHNFLKLICNCNSIGVLATAESTSKLNRSIYSSRGSHLFKNHYSILEFTKADRKTLLEQLFSKHMCEGISFDGLAIKTEGFVMQDIMDFFSKTIFESYKEDTENTNAVIRESHCENALKNTCVMSLQNVQFHTSGTKSFENVGGLHNVKDVLIESLLWPAQYPTIFSNSPLRLQSGLLLYGPPGTGKTLLAGAAAIHFGLRLISIKGPELLSKYIGASEQAVRDVFEKAQSARPCILFFDEFDSLAPRRGHDNTGVTDRVVNQLLTQLDGVESLSGVCVLAATSRPDLLDPALLRPGRLDKQLLCPLPNMMDRLEVLQVLSKNLDLATDIKLKEVAERTEGYSGADLQSILYTAQLSSVNYLFEDLIDGRWGYLLPN